MPEHMSGQELRNTFLSFFGERDHTVVPSGSLIPNDPGLLLTVAGMVPFKPYLLGEEPPPYPRAVTVQKCIRTVDIEVVGTTARHLTFFEMLGNFSFGDYFKETAIPLAYQLITEGLGFEPERLWYTVHHDDDEAAEIWIDGVGVPADRVQRRGNDNFWQMGVPGPAGPSSEIFYDRGPEFGPDGGPVVDEERFMEFWNLVFMQNIQDRPYHVVGDLPAKNIDTGAGLERVLTLLQGVDNVFETDVVAPVLAVAERHTGAAYGADPKSDEALRIIADHGRALTFLIGDGVVPSNEGRGYILRRLLRRAVRHARVLGSDRPITPALVEATIEVMGAAYPALRDAQDGITEMAEREEARFRRTLDTGYSMLESALEELSEGDALPGRTAFKLHDTYGFPVELTEEIAAEREVSVDREEFEAEMEAQRARARAAIEGSSTDEMPPAVRKLVDRHGLTEFVGYETVTSTGKILSMVRDGEAVERAGEGDAVEVFVDRTPFYAESGGQVGDTGTLTSETGAATVADTQHAIQGLHGHRAVVGSGELRVGQEVELTVDPGRREKIRKSHTGTHILHWALRDQLGHHVQQGGSLVTDGRLRFDFSHYAGVDADELADIERRVNERIIENARVTTQVVDRAEAEAQGAIAFFGDKYGERVRVVQTGEYSKELCGGTHVPTTGQVGPLVVVSESSIGSNMRRVEALTGIAAFEYVLDLRDRLHATADRLRTSPDRIVDAAGSLTNRLKEQEERIEAFLAKERNAAAGSLLDHAESVGSARLVVAELDDLDPGALRSLALQLRAEMESGVAVLGSQRDGKAGLIALVTPDLAAKGVAASDIVMPAARLVGGGGSRDPELSQAGGPNGDRIGEALEAARSEARSRLEGV